MTSAADGLAEGRRLAGSVERKEVKGKAGSGSEDVKVYCGKNSTTKIKEVTESV